MGDIMSQKKRLIVIGNGMVGYKFCEKLLATTQREDFIITVFGDEPRPAYDRVHLTEYFAGKSAAELSLAPLNWYQENQIDLKINTKIQYIDRHLKSVYDQNLEKYDYDFLVLATGSSAFLPTVPGIEKQGVFVYRTIEDLEAITAYGKKVKTAAVIGGGLLGLEAAKAMLDMGLETHVIEFAPFLMARQLDANGAAFLKAKIEELGVKVHLAKNTTQINGDGKVSGLQFQNGENLFVDMLVVSAGIRPRDELAKICHLETGSRGGIVVNDQLLTSDKNIFAIGECALHRNNIYGLVAPGYRMAEVAVKNLCGEKALFTGADLSTQLKLLGIDVASFGNILVDNKENLPVTLENWAQGIYKKLIVSKDGQRLLGGILVGDASDYNRLLGYYQNQIPLLDTPENLLVKAAKSSATAAVDDTLPNHAIVCNCENIPKSTLVEAITHKGCTDIVQLKKCTKSGSGCGGCVPLMKDILSQELKAKGIKVSKALCEHFDFTRSELRELIHRDKLRNYVEILAMHGKGRGCEICKPAVASIIAGCWNEPILKQPLIQDTNDFYLANIQKNGTYSVVPRVPGGEITPEQLILIGQVAVKFNLYTKITGGQRIDLFGARLEDLPKIWAKLVEGGMESGHAYGKALRTVKSCVGWTWCRFGVQDSTAMAIEIENRYKGLRAPHKIKGAVSGCSRECAEAQSKDFGVIATEKGWNLYVCGNGGMKPQHAQLLASDLDGATLIRYIDRFLMYYLQTAEHLIRTATWLNKLSGGIERLKEIIVNDALGIGAQLEQDMQSLVIQYECEWAGALKDPEKLKRFRPFLNTADRDPTVKFVAERGQIKPLVDQDLV